MIEFKIKKQLEYFLLDVDFSFESGTLVINGESGSGKTTILNCISGLDEPHKGKISINKRIVFDNTADRVNLMAKDRNVGYVFQNYALFPHMSVIKNITYGIGNVPKTKKMELLEYANELMEKFGIMHLKDRHPGQISGGEKQRVSLVRSIVLKPELLILDEPFSALDTKTKHMIYKEYLNFKNEFKIPTILVTHSQEESNLLGDKIILLEDGKIVYNAK